MPTLSKVIENATPDELFEVLSDYQRYPAWTADCVAATVLYQERNVVVAEFVAPQLMEKKYVLECFHSHPNSITYHQVDQFHDDWGLTGNWQLRPQGDGVRVTGEMNFKTSRWPWKNGSNQKNVHLILQRRLDVLGKMSFAAEAPDLIPPEGPAGFVLGGEIVRTLRRGDTTSVPFLGKRYRLSPKDSKVLAAEDAWRAEQ